MKTDPQNSDYVVESGATRNFEPWRAEDEVAENEKRKRDAEEMGDAMKSLENRTLDSKREMDILAALDEMKSMKSRHATVNVDEMLEALQRTAEEKEKKLEVEDEALIKTVFFRASEDFVRRIPDEEDDDSDEDLYQPISSSGEPSNTKRRKITDEVPGGTVDSTNNDSDNKEMVNDVEAHKPKFIIKSPSVTFKVVKKPPPAPIENRESKVENKQEESKASEMNTGLQSLCQNYNSDESD